MPPMNSYRDVESLMLIHYNQNCIKCKDAWWGLFVQFMKEESQAQNERIKCMNFVEQKIIHNNGHPSLFVEIDGKLVDVDVELVPLILELNKLGLKTNHSCQGDDCDTDYASIGIIINNDVKFEFFDSMLMLSWKRRKHEFSK